MRVHVHVYILYDWKFRLQQIFAVVVECLAAEQSFDMYVIHIVLELCVAEKKERKKKGRR